MDQITGFPDDLITDQETADDFEVQTSTLAWWRSQGQGPDFYKIGRKVFYSRALNAEWKAQRRRKPRNPRQLEA